MFTFRATSKHLPAASATPLPHSFVIWQVQACAFVPPLMSRIALIPIALLLAWLGGGTWYWLSQDRLDAMALDVQMASDLGKGNAKGPSLTITYHDKVWLDLRDDLRFARHQAQAPLTDRMRMALEKLAFYLLAHEDKELEIIGRYQPSERTPRHSPNLGLARAAFIAQELLRHGVQPNRFIKLPEVVADSAFVGDTLLAAIRMRLLDRPVPLPYDATTLDSLTRVEQARAGAWAKELTDLSDLERGGLSLSGIDPAIADSLVAIRQAQMEAWARQRNELSALEKGHLPRAGLSAATLDSLIAVRQAQVEAWARERNELSALEKGQLNTEGMDATTLDSLIAVRQAQAEAWAHERNERSALEKGQLSSKGLDAATLDSLIARRQAQAEAWARERNELSALERGQLSRAGYSAATIDSLMNIRQQQMQQWATARLKPRGVSRGSIPVGRRFYFGYNRFDLVLDDEARQYLTEVIQFMRSQRRAVLYLTGHADNTGDPAHNHALSRKRAETMQQFFQAFGLPAARTRIAFEGDTHPIASNQTEQGRAQNRRVEVDIRFP